MLFKKVSKVISAQALSSLSERYPSTIIVQCHGVFDVLHAGHLAYFNSAKKMGDILVVTVTADEYVNKGPGRPYFTGAVRAEMIAALEVVDYVAISPYPTAVQAIRMLKPKYYVKGPDYREKTLDITGAILEEEAAVVAGGGKLVFTQDNVHSSSELINKFFQRWTEEQENAINDVKKLGGIAFIEDLLEKISKEVVTVVGEPIVDSYVFCEPENISSKSPSISAKFLFRENYAGGALAVANNVSDFVQRTNLLITQGGEDSFADLLSSRLDKRIELCSHIIPNFPTPTKTRFIAVGENQRLFELTDLRSDQWTTHSPAKFCLDLSKHNSANGTTLLADFGHGLFEGAVLDGLSNLKGFIGLNVQTNSSNFGFNPFTKHQHFSYLSIDTKEARVAYHNRFTPPLWLARKVREDLRRRGAACSMTLGSNGAYFFPGNSDSEFFAPAMAETIVDKTGAGDAFFAITSLLTKVGCAPEAIPFLGNVFAGLKIRIMGHKESVSKAQFFKALVSILK